MDTLIKELEGLKIALPKSECRNAENEMFGRCFNCEKTRGFNLGVDAAIELIKELK